MDVVLGTALILMYGRSGMVEQAEHIFNWMRDAIGVDLMAWSAMISVYGRSGKAAPLKSMLDRMHEDGTQPNAKTFGALINACAHGGLIDDAMSYYHIMQKQYNIVPNNVVLNCVVDALSRAGRIKNAIDFIESNIAAPDIVTWKSVLGAARLLVCFIINSFVLVCLFIYPPG